MISADLEEVVLTPKSENPSTCAQMSAIVASVHCRVQDALTLARRGLSPGQQAWRSIFAWSKCMVNLYKQQTNHVFRPAGQKLPSQSSALAAGRDTPCKRPAASFRRFSEPDTASLTPSRAQGCGNLSGFHSVPRIFTWSSTRPRNSMQPSGSLRTMSPVRITSARTIRRPITRTNRRDVSPGYSRIPATPVPAMCSSPATPWGQ